VKGSQAELLAELVQSALAGEHELVDVYREPVAGQEPQLIAQGYEITLSSVLLPDHTIVHITPLTSLQSRILQLLDLPTSISTDLAANPLPNPP
jgi:hypothetical protein